MKIKLLLTLVITFSVISSPVYSQVDISQLEDLDLDQLEALQQLQENAQDTEDSTESGDSAEILPMEEDEPKDEVLPSFEVDNFGYKGRDDFLVAPNYKYSREPLQSFGYDYFVNDPNIFLPSKDTPIPPDYVLGPGDTVKILLYGTQNRRYTLEVTREGDIFLPEIGPISVAGSTFSDIKANINQIVDNQQIGSKVSLTLGELRSINIFVFKITHYKADNK